MRKLKIVFAGTPQYAADILQALLEGGYHITTVLTQPDRKSGRGRKQMPSEVKQIAMQHDIPVLQPENLRDEKIIQQLKDLQPDIILVVAYGLLLPENILNIPNIACINVHPSILPRWRGAAPIQYALLAGDHKTGVAIMQMTRGLDSGPVYQQVECDIAENDNAVSLTKKLTALSINTLGSVLDQLAVKSVTPQSQAETNITYAHKINKEDAMIDWQKSARDIHNQIRAFNPAPVAFADFQEQRVRIYQAHILEEKSNHTPGIILQFTKQGLDIACGKGSIRILTMQFVGGKVLNAAEIYNGKRNFFRVGEYFGWNLA